MKGSSARDAWAELATQLYGHPIGNAPPPAENLGPEGRLLINRWPGKASRFCQPQSRDHLSRHSFGAGASFHAGKNLVGNPSVRVTLLLALCFELREHAGDVAHPPMLGDFAVADAEDVTGREAQGFAGRRHSEINALMGSGVDEARCGHVTAR
jgi:hypothetical protein